MRRTSTFLGLRPFLKGLRLWSGLFLGLCLFLPAYADLPPKPIMPEASPLVGQMPDSLKGEAHFLIGGHLYGSHDNVESIFPASSFLAFLPRLKEWEPDIFISLGDMMRDGQSSSQQNALFNVLRSMGMPVFNAPGNHDLAGGDRYAATMGPLNQVFWVGPDLVVILNTEQLLVQGGASELKGFVENIFLNRTPRHLLVCGHRPFWALFESGMEVLDEWANEPMREKVNREECKAVFEALKGMPITGQRVWMAGDAGAKWSLSTWYERRDREHFLLTGIGDMERDMLVSIRPRGSEDLDIQLLHLDDGTATAPDAYGTAYWKKWFATYGASEPGWSERVALMLSKRSFWAGAAGGALLILLAWMAWGLIRRRRSK